jgi:LysM repeat protein
VVLAVVAFTATAAIISPIGTRRIARATAEREIEALLANDEAVLARAYAAQRRPADLWRLSHGLLVATNRRVLYLGAPPNTLLRPYERGPQELYVESFPYDAAYTMARRDGRGGPLITLRTPTRTVTWRVEADQVVAADSVRLLAERARQRAGEEAERLRQTGTPTPRPERYTTHIVRRGETLTGIARRFLTSVDVLRQLNGLRDSAVRTGQRLRVPELMTPTDPFADPDDTTAVYGPPPA